LVTVEAMALRGWLLLVVGALSACDQPHSMPPIPDGGPPLALTILDPPGSQIGLHYSKSVVLRVSYHADDDAQTPEKGSVLFSIFGDPAGSTLSADHVTTDSSGIAQVTLTAGAAEATFRVTASAPNTGEVDFQVAVSKLDFVELKVQLDWDASAPTTLRALLYANQPCASLPPTPSLPPTTAMREVAKPGPSATVDFINLLSMSYSVVGRAEDMAGHLLAYGCVDVPSALAPAGSTANLPLPLSAVTPDATGSYALTTALTPVSAPVTQPWHALSDCPLGLGQSLLDNTSAALSSASLQAAIAGLRGAPSGTNSCRPSQVMVGASAVNSLDADLEALLTDSGDPGLQLGALVDDLDSLTGAAQLASTLTLTPTGGATLAGEHALGKLALGSASGAQETIDLPASGLPIIDVKDIAVGYDQGLLSIGAHGFTLHLPALWQGAFETVAIGTRFPALMPPSTRGWLGLAVGAVMHGGMVGCSGVEDLICTRTAASGCTGVIAPACLKALDQMTTQLEAGFQVTPGVDFTLSGQCTGLDSDGNLTLDQLTAGNWTTVAASTATFTGSRQ
jgi:hypothetical protein